MIILYSVILSLVTFLFNGCNQIIDSSSKEKIVGFDTIRINVGNSPGSVEAADFNNDGFNDLAVTSETDSNVTILLGNGKGDFTEAFNSPFFTSAQPNDIVIRDFNKDGNIDMAFANHERQYLTVLLGDGKGSFTSAPYSPFKTLGIPHTHGIAAGDFNNDGRLDLVTDSWGNNKIEILFGDSLTLFKTKGVFFNVGRRPYQRLRVNDLNNDKFDDIVTTNSEGNNVTILLNDGKGSFTEAPGSPFACGDVPFGLSIADLNGDGMPDLAVLNSPSSMAAGKGKNGLTILLGDGKGKFTLMYGSPFEAGKIPNRIATGDIDGDGTNDIVTSDNETREIYLFLSNRKGNVSATQIITVGRHPKGLAISDLNGDGKNDIVVCNQLDNDISILISM